MSKLLLVRSGASENPVTKTIELSVDEIKHFIVNRRLRFLGNKLVPIGETNRMSDFVGPDHVVLELEEAEKEELNIDEVGFYLIEGLSPSDVVKKN
jgi:hypothetical protein